jgi:hypothetical protein
MPQVLGQGNCQYTVLNTAGTTTLNPGQASGPPTSTGVLFGVTMTAVGTGYGVTMLDIIPASGNVATSTNTLMNGTSTAVGARLVCGLEGVGVRYKGALVAVTSGTAGAYNALWD